MTPKLSAPPVRPSVVYSAIRTNQANRYARVFAGDAAENGGFFTSCAADLRLRFARVFARVQGMPPRRLRPWRRSHARNQRVTCRRPPRSSRYAPPTPAAVTALEPADLLPTPVLAPKGATTSSKPRACSPRADSILKRLAPAPPPVLSGHSWPCALSIHGHSPT